ncbi:hypothetical protein N0V92_006611 [Colletotrichum tropicale]|nr:hypothetical protein N0V92_006611 [Colletotrichum tropicale]
MADLFGSSSGNSNNHPQIPNTINHNSNDNLGHHLRPDRPPTAAPATTTNNIQSDLSAPSASASAGPGPGAATAVTASASSVSPKPTKRSSTTTCVTCRARKVRCDGRREVCSNCDRLGFNCTYEDPNSDPNGLSSGPSFPLPRRRSRDDGAHDSDAGGPEVMASNTPSTFNQELSASDPQFESLISRALDNFFRHVHHIPMLSFLHRASLMQRHHAGGLDRPLLLALIGITSMLTDLGPGTKEYGEKCVDESEALILKSLENPSTIKVQTLALIIKYRILTRRFSSAFVLAATAARFAMALRLNHENSDLCFLAQESRRRLMWALFMIDQGMAGGYRDLTLWSPELIHIPLPCNERDFEFDLAPPSMRSLVPQPDESENDDIGSLALHVRILWVRGRILKFAKRAAACSKDDDLARMRDQLQAFAKELSEFAERLPVSFRWSDNSLRLRAYSPRLCVFIMIHIWWRSDFSAQCQRQCFEHALEMSNMFTSIKQLDHYPVADLDMPVCAYQCVRMLYYIYHLNAEEYGLTPDVLRKKASICLDVTKGCCSGTAANAIQTDLQRLMDHGLSIQATPSRLVSEEPHDERNGNGPKRVSRLGRAKQVQLVDDPDSGAPAADELTNRPFGIGAWEDIQVVESDKPDEEMLPAPPPAGPGSLEVNNAFEGALDSLDFNMEPMGLESLAWFSNEWSQGDFQDFQ